MAFNEHFIDDIRARADIVEVISDYVKLEQRGKNHTGLCPFHQEKSPSFNVNREKQLYYCFGCGAGGDIFNFLMEIENLPFIEAAKILAERYGVEIPEKPTSAARRKEDEVRDQLFAIHEWTAKFYQYLLSEHIMGKAALQYFESRGFTKETMEKFRLGYSPEGWTGLFNFLQKKGFSESLLTQSGLILPGKTNGFYDRFRARAMFTIFNLRGQPIAFGGRVMKKGENPKYLNSPETVLFEKNQNLFGLNFAKDVFRQTKQAIMMEGYTDVITAHQYGIENAVASLGTALTDNQAHLLARYVEEVFIAYDADTAGQNATLRGLDILKEAGLRVKVVKLPDDTDPDELIRMKGADGFRECLEQAVSLIDFKLNQVLSQYDIKNPDDKVKAVKELLPLFLNIDNAIERDYVLDRISSEVYISRAALEEELGHFLEEKSKNKDKTERRWHNKKEEKKVIQPKTSPFEERFLNAILRKPDYLSKVFAEISPEVFQTPEYRAIVQQIYSYFSHEGGQVKTGLNTSQIVELFHDEDWKKEVMKISFLYPESEVTEIFINEGLKKLKEYQKAMEMETILKEIKHIKNHGKLADLNQVLIRYHRMLHRDSGKGGC